MGSGPMASGSAQRLQQLLREQDVTAATAQVSTALTDLLGAPVGQVQFTLDAYSLNSVSGTFESRGQELFFKFHTEEGEEATVGEYYRAELLAAAGIPVDLPVAYSSDPGNQLVVYRRRRELRMADVCREIERAGGSVLLPTDLRDAQRRLDARIGAVMVGSLHPANPASAEISLHQLFHTRMVERGRFPGGRYAKWYLDSPDFAEVADASWRIDGVQQVGTLRELGARMVTDRAPGKLAALPVVTAHGDDHQGNIWVQRGREGTELSLFDPAFASALIPALLAPIKATYHNVFAHPFWLYHPDEASAPVVRRVDGRIEIETDPAVLSPMRAELLASLTDLVWVPLLLELRSRDLLPRDWTRTVRSALAACPLLVTDLSSSARPEPVRLLGLARVVQAGLGGETSGGPIGTWLEELTAALA